MADPQIPDEILRGFAQDEGFRKLSPDAQDRVVQRWAQENTKYVQPHENVLQTSARAAGIKEPFPYLNFIPGMKDINQGLVQGQQEMESQYPGETGRNRTAEFTKEMGGSILTGNIVRGATKSLPAIARGAITGAASAQPFHYDSMKYRAVGTAGASFLGGTIEPLVEGIGAVKNAIGDLGQLRRAPSVFAQRASDITSRATREEGALKGYEDFRTGQIQSEGNKLIDSATKQTYSKANQSGPDPKAFTEIQSQIDKLSKGADSLEKQTLPNVAWESGKKAVLKMKDVITKQGNKWNQDLQSLLGGKDTDTFIDPEKITSALTKTLKDNGVSLYTDDAGALQASRPLSSAENKIINLIKNINEKASGPNATGYGVREMLREGKLLGQDVNYGKQWTGDDFIINEARHNIVSEAKDLIPGLSEHYDKWAEWAPLRNKMVKNFDVFGDKYSEAGRSFIQKEVSGQLTPAQKSLASDIKGKVGDYSAPAKQVQSGIEGKRLRVENLKSTLSDLEDKIKTGKSLSDAEVQNIKDTFQKHIDDEIQNVKDITQKEIVSLQNRTGAAKERLSAIQSKAQAKIDRLKNIPKLMAITGGAGASLVGLWKAGGWLLHLTSGDGT